MTTVRLPGNMDAARFTITKIAYLGKKTGSIARAGTLWEPNTATYQLSGRVLNSSRSAVSGAIVTFSSTSLNKTSPASVVTDANGNWTQIGFVEKMHYRVAIAKTDDYGTWTFGSPTIGDYRYRFYQVWMVFFKGLAIVFLLLLYREWKKLGGDEHYVPPTA